MTPTLAVVDLLLGDGVLAALRSTTVTNAGAWPQVVAAATRCSVASQLHARIDPSAVPAAGLDPLRRDSLVSRLRSQAVARSAGAVFDLFNSNGIAFIAVKGLAAIASMPDGRDVRTTTDCDVLVHERDEARARELLASDGFVEVDPPIERHLPQLVNDRPLHNVARTLMKGTCVVDLHWRFGVNPPEGLETDRLLERSVDAMLLGKPVRVPCAVDSVLIAVHHALRCSFNPVHAVRDLDDLARWWNDPQLMASMSDLIDAARRSRIVPSLAALLHVIVRRNRSNPAMAAYEALLAVMDRSERREAVLLELHIEDVLRRGVPAAFSLDVFAPRIYARWALHRLTRRLAPQSPEAPQGLAEVPVRRTLAERLQALPGRCWRVVRDLTRPGALASYDAVSRAQARYR